MVNGQWSMVIKLLRIQLALSGWARCSSHKELKKIFVQVKGTTAYSNFRVNRPHVETLHITSLHRFWFLMCGSNR
jgi:hypothetical protein